MIDSVRKAPLLAIACGGTGGHFFPGLSIAREFIRHGGEAVLLIGGSHSAEQIKAAQKVGVQAIAAPAIRLPRNPLAWPFAAFKYLSCIRENKHLLTSQHATAALCMGSFACLPMGLAAHKLGLPLFVHEGNSCLGRANRLLSRKAHTLFLSFPLANEETTKAQQSIVGMPVRTQLRQAVAEPLSDTERGELRRALGLDPGLPTLLVFGGSQGAKFINELMLETVARLRGKDRTFQLIHLTGSKHNADYDMVYKQIGLKCYVQKRERSMERLYQAADLVLCRAGASTIFELALFGKPAWLIPLPSALDDHQRANAEYVVASGGAQLFDQAAIGPELLHHKLKAWLADPDGVTAMGDNIATLAKPHAAHGVVAGICEALDFEMVDYNDPVVS